MLDEPVAPPASQAGAYPTVFKRENCYILCFCEETDRLIEVASTQTTQSSQGDNSVQRVGRFVRHT